MTVSFAARWRHCLSRWRARLAGPRMVHGYWRADGRFLPHTRVASSTVIEGREGLDLADHVFIGHHNFIDASAGVSIGECCQITNHVSILSHSSHRSLRVHGRSYFGDPDPVGYRRAATRIGERVFIGPHTVIAPGSHIGDGALIRAHSYVSGEVPAFAVMSSTVAGQPAVAVGDVREADAALIALHPSLHASHRDWLQRAGRR